MATGGLKNCGKQILNLYKGFWMLVYKRSMLLGNKSYICTSSTSKSILIILTSCELPFFGNIFILLCSKKIIPCNWMSSFNTVQAPTFYWNCAKKSYIEWFHYVLIFISCLWLLKKQQFMSSLPCHSVESRRSVISFPILHRYVLNRC